MQFFSKKVNGRAIISVLLALILLLSSFSAIVVSADTIPASEEYKMAFKDDLTRTDGTLGNDWNIGNYARTSFDADNELLLKSYHGSSNNDYLNHIDTSALMRPTSEASLNQTVSVDFESLATGDNRGAFLIARCQGDRPTADNCYSAGLFDSDKSNLRLWIFKGAGDARISNDASIWTTGGLPANTKYHLEFTVTSINATTTNLVAKLYSFNNDGSLNLISTQTTTDSTPALQNPGTVGFSVRDKYGNDFRFKNFCFTPINGWNAGSYAKTSVADDGKLLLTSSHGSSNNDNQIHIDTTALMRPTSEASLNQTVSVDFKSLATGSQRGAFLIARCQGDRPTADNCYSAGLFDSDGDNLRLWIYKGAGDARISNDASIWTTGGLPANTKYHLEFTVTSIDATTTYLVAKLYSFNNDNSLSLIYTQTATDNTSALQNPGTVGFSVRDMYGKNFWFDNFSYAPEEPESENIIFEDNFDREDGYVANDWIPLNTANANTSYVIANNQLKIIDDPSSHNGVCTRILERPMSTAGLLDQRVSVEIHNMDSLSNFCTANIHLRNIHQDHSNSDQSYYVETAYDHIMIKQVKTDWTTKAVSEEAAEYKNVVGHVYRVEFTAQGQYPTKLNATLYDVTAGDIAVATVSAEDSTAGLQKCGTVALSATANQAGQNYALFDNFVYSQADTIICNDNLTRTDGTLGNDWNVGPYAKTSFNDKGELLLTSSHGNNNSDGQTHIDTSALMRPMSEASLNQTISVDFEYSVTGDNRGVFLIARCQGDRPTADNCYSAGLFDSDGSNLRLWIYKGAGGAAGISHNESISTTGGLPNNRKYHLEFTVTSIDKNTTKLVASYYEYDEDGSLKLIYTQMETDTTPALQNPGTVGISVRDKAGKQLWLNNFSYSTPKVITQPTTYRFLETEYDNSYKNLYYRASDADAYDSSVLKQTSDTCKAISYDNLTDSLNQNSAYVAYPVYAREAGTYSFKLRFKMGADNASALASSNPYAAVIVNGNSKVKFDFTAQSGEYCISEFTDITLNSGVNMLYLMAPTSEIVNSAVGAYIDYDCIIAEKVLSAVSGSFSLPGDINSDKVFDLLDLVRFKKYFAGLEVTIDRFAADLTTEQGKVIIDVNDLVNLEKSLIGISDSNFSWLKLIDSEEINPLSVISDEFGGANAVAATKKAAILNATDLTPTATTYYVSSNGSSSANGTSPSTPWNLTKLKNSYLSLKSGDTVLFERGSVFRQGMDDTSSLLTLKSGVSYGAYGQGAKPRFYGSAINYANATWTLDSGNIWKTDLAFGDDGIDAGIIVFDNGSSVGVKKSSLEELTSGNDFYHDTENGVLYVYSKIGSPAELYKDIEIGSDRFVFLMDGRASGIKIDNIDIRYVGSHAIKGNNDNENITITNCDISFVGGSIQDSSDTGVRYGNAIEFYNNAADITVENCWIHQVYDAGLTFQCSLPNTQYHNITFSNNLLQYCNYSVEFFIGSEENAPGELDNIDITDNIMQFAGFGVCEQRPSTKDSAHICGWVTNVGSQDTDVTISGNTFDIANYNIVNWHWSGDANNNIKVSDNTYFMKPSASSVAVYYSTKTQKNAFDQTSLEEAVNVFDSNPVSVTWLNN